jgi:HSP20 family molecular chaperone IbpA
MNRRNRKKNPNDIFGLEELLDAWMDMMAVIPQIDARAMPKTALFGKPKHEGTMSYEERDKDIVFTIDMPGVDKKDIDVKVEDHSITVKAENGGSRKYNYSRKFKPTVDINSAVATFKNGVLDITLTKIEEASKGKSIKIK